MQSSMRSQISSVPKNAKNAKLQQKQNEIQTLNMIFEMDYHLELFLSRCQDTGEKPDLEKAKMFRESFNKINSKKFPHVFNLYSMRLGVNTIMKLMSILETNHFTILNLADNSISEYGMHAVKNLINSTRIQSLNLASNMISEIGLSLVLDDLIRNNKLKCLDLGILEGSIRKNSIGIDGSRCLAAILLQNKTLESLRLEDNDIGINGAEIISIPLKKNKVLKDLKIAENLVKTQGAEYILTNGLYLQSLDLGKNFIKSSIGFSLKKYLETNLNIKKINLELNQLSADGCKILFEGVVNSKLVELNLRGNLLTDRGIQYMAEVLKLNGKILEYMSVLDLSSNEISFEGTKYLLDSFEYLQLKNLNLSKNSLGDEGISQLMSGLKGTITGQYIEKLDFSGCKISDKGFIKLLQEINEYPQLRYLRVGQNYISERYEKIYMELLDKNRTIINLNLNGNRLSLSGIKGIKRIVDRNLKNFEEKEPKKIKSQIYNLKEKQKKIKEAQDRLERQKREISNLEELKAKLNDTLSKIQRQEKEKKYQYDQIIRKKMQQLDQMNLNYQQKVKQLQKTNIEKKQILEKLNNELDDLRAKRKQLEYHLSVAQNQGDSIQKEFQMKINSLQ